MILAFEDGTGCDMFAQNLRELEFVDPSVSVPFVFIGWQSISSAVFAYIYCV